MEREDPTPGAASDPEAREEGSGHSPLKPRRPEPATGVGSDRGKRAGGSGDRVVAVAGVFATVLGAVLGVVLYRLDDRVTQLQDAQASLVSEADLEKSEDDFKQRMDDLQLELQGDVNRWVAEDLPMVLCTAVPDAQYDLGRRVCMVGGKDLNIKAVFRD